MKRVTIFFFLSVALASTVNLSANTGKWYCDLETGIVWSGYNDVAIPRSTGTPFSLTNDFKTAKKLIYRLRLGYRIAERHDLSILLAPLSLNATGEIKEPFLFYNTNFKSSNSAGGLYRFNSWRLTYRYRLLNKTHWQIWLGFTAKIRDAEIRITTETQSGSKTNVGFVPLLNFSIHWLFSKSFALLLEGDALAAPGGQGRAEDIFLGLTWKASGKIQLRAGYRLVEGGADVEEVYNFALLNYLLAGISLKF